MVLFKIRLDRVGIYDKQANDLSFIRTTCMPLGPNFTFRPMDEEVLFTNP